MAPRRDAPLSFGLRAETLRCRFGSRAETLRELRRRDPLGRGSACFVRGSSALTITERRACIAEDELLERPERLGDLRERVFRTARIEPHTGPRAE